MVHLVGYFGCAAISIVMMGVVFHALVWPTLKCRKKSVLGLVVSVVFGFGMLHSMAVKPGGDDALQGPRRSPPQQTAEPTNAVEIVTTTNTHPWETTLAFSQIEATPSNVQLTVAWPMGFYNYDPILDLFITYPMLTNDWQWTSCQSVPSTTTNCSFTITPNLLGLTELPPALFAHVTERTEACEAMDDPDGDGIPNPFEFHHGTNPYVPDASLIQTLDCTDTDFSTLKSVLANSTEYSIINLPTGTIDAADTIFMPPHPVLLSGPKDGYTVIKSTGYKGAFRFEDGQDSHTLIRNVYLDLLKRDSFQVGFWSGGNLPWSGIGASPSFVNIVIRMPRPETEYIGWLFYGDNGKTASLSNCFVNALGATWVRGIETGNGPAVDVKDFTCINTPTNFTNTLSRTFTLGNSGRTNQITSVGHEATVFIDLSPGVDSDGDGIPNDQEVNELGTDPWLADSDGDGITDPEELIAETNPLDVLSFLHGVVIEVTNTTAVAGSQVYVSWERIGDCPDNGFLTNSSARSFFTSYSIPHTNGEVRINCFRDLNGNAIFDPDYDIAMTQSVPDRSEYTRLKFTFGDVDHDGVNDKDERIDGTDPYSALSLKITRTVRLTNNDMATLITNYVCSSTSRVWREEDEYQTWNTRNVTKNISLNAQDGQVYVKCYRDLNRNGHYDEHIDPLYVFTVENSPKDEAYIATILDYDSDSIPDSIELSEGTDPLNRRNYCYMPTLFVEGVFTTTNNLIAQAFFGTNAVAAAHIVTNKIVSYCFGHLVTTNSEIASIMFWDDINGNNTLDDGEPFSTSYCAPREHITVATNNLAYSHFDSDSNLLPDWWESISGLKNTGAPVKWFNDADSDGLVNLHEYWCGTDPLTPDGSNTVLSILSRSIDDRITTLKDTNVFLNYSAPPFERNTNCWAYGINLTCASPYNSALRTNMAGTAISPRHIIIASHYPYGSNTVVRFCDSQSSDVIRTVIARQTIPNTDISICLLDNPLPDTVEPAKILPSDYTSYIGNGRGLPLLELDQEEHAIIVDKYPISQGKGETSAYQSNDANRLKYYEPAISGDSGDPVFFIYNQMPILLYCLHSGGGGAGPFTTCYASEIQNAMDELSSRYHKPHETLQFVDFTHNDKIEREFK